LICSYVHFFDSSYFIDFSDLCDSRVEPASSLFTTSMASRRELDIVLLGATGYTGKWTAEHITTHLPTNIKWAIAGRSESKLNALSDELKSLNSNRTPPSIITTQLTAPELNSLAKKTRVLINTVGPYHLYSTPVVQACAETGTHYVDATGETPWVKEIIIKFDAAAKKSGAIIIPEVGIESAPSDLIAYAAAKLIRKVWDCGVMDMVGAVHELKSSGASGGTLATGLGLMDHYPASAMKEMVTNPFLLSPTQLRPYTKDTIYPPTPQPNTYDRSTMQKFTGVWNYPRLGTLATSITAKPNEAIVHRSAGLNPYLYGFNFSYEEFMAVNSTPVGMMIHFALATLTFLLAIPPFRMLFKALAPYKPGAGPTKESSKQDAFEMRGVAVAEQLSKIPRKAMATLRFEGGMYELTGLFLAEAAMTLLDVKAVEEVKRQFGAGLLTPACLGDPFVERVKDAGVKLEVKQIGDTGSK
jgi:short subunit dehydrogenase-like uncharacterized protein